MDLAREIAFIMNDVVPGLNQGFWVSLRIIVPSALLGLVLGVVVGAVRVFGRPWMVKIADAYVAVFRGTPLVVQLFFWYFALPYAAVGDFRIVLGPVSASIVGFALCSGAYHSEYIRGGLNSIKGGQLKAAYALGMSPLTTIRHIILPQAFRRALPGCGNEIIYLVKYSSLASIITVNELTGVGRGIAKETWKNTEVFLVVGAYYLVLVSAATLLLRKWEKKLHIPGFGKAA
jgi:polar amino acid transport system permease protein